MTTILQPVLAHLAVHTTSPHIIFKNIRSNTRTGLTFYNPQALPVLHLEAPRLTEDATTLETIPTLDPDIEVETARSSDGGPRGHPHDDRDIVTATVIAKVIARAVEAEATVGVEAEARGGVDHTMDKKVERL